MSIRESIYSFLCPACLNRLITKRLLPASTFDRAFVNQVEAAFQKFWNPSLSLPTNSLAEVQSWIIPLLPCSTNKLENKINSIRKTFQPIALNIKTPDGAVLDATLFRHQKSEFSTGEPLTIVVPMASGELHKMGTYSWIFDLINRTDQIFNVISFDYRGVGASQGRITPTGLKIDISTILKYLQQQQVSVGKTIIYGYSLAGAISVEALNITKIKIRQLILDRTFASLEKMIAHLLGGGFIAKICGKYSKKAGWNFMSDRNLFYLTEKITILFSQEDLVIPFQQSLYHELKRQKKTAHHLITAELKETRGKNEEHHNLPLNFFSTKNSKSLIDFLSKNIFFQ